jgi:GTPase Era involved in 16S rRNA processing
MEIKIITREMKYTIFVGTPRAGDSTVLNGALIGEPLFRSGISFGERLTITYLQFEKAKNGDCWYVDTAPGLADVKLREKNALEISKAVRKFNADFKLVLVVTESEGRVLPAYAGEGLWTR